MAYENTQKLACESLYELPGRYHRWYMMGYDVSACPLAIAIKTKDSAQPMVGVVGRAVNLSVALYHRCYFLWSRDKPSDLIYSPQNYHGYRRIVQKHMDVRRNTSICCSPRCRSPGSDNRETTRKLHIHPLDWYSLFGGPDFRNTNLRST